MPYASSPWNPNNVNGGKKALQLVEVLFCFYFGGLKLITDPGLCLHVQNEMSAWANYFNKEERKIHFSFHYLKISGLCNFKKNSIMWKVGLRPSFHLACLETASQFVSERVGLPSTVSMGPEGLVETIESSEILV